jgi:hypothetical protein
MYDFFTAMTQLIFNQLTKVKDNSELDKTELFLIL